MITPEEFNEAMLYLSKLRDLKEAHLEAVELMAEVLDLLGYSEGVLIYRDMIKDD